MRKAFSLMEVIIAVTLISIVLTALLESKNNNINLLGRVNSSITNDSFIACAMLLSDLNATNKDEKIYLKDQFDLKDDDLRRYIKNIVVVKKVEQLDPLEFDDENLAIKVNIDETRYTLKDGISKKLHTFSLEY